MPLWNAVDFVTSLSRHRVPVEVITATVMSDGEDTQAVALPTQPLGNALDVSFDVKFASNPPGAVDYRLQVANLNLDANYEDIGTAMTNSNTIGGIVVVSNVMARFARVTAADADSVAVTINIMVQ